jgi:hypothetical protein
MLRQVNKGRGKREMRVRLRHELKRWRKNVCDCDLRRSGKAPPLRYGLNRAPCSPSLPGKAVRRSRYQLLTVNYGVRASVILYFLHGSAIISHL